MPSIEQTSNSSDGVTQRFSVVVGKTYCPYACKTNIQFAPDWDPSLTTEDNIERLLPCLDRFVEREEFDALDMFVIEVRGCDAISSINAFARLLHYILYTLNKVDPTRKASLTDGITSKEWDFTYKGLRFFVPTFAPFYSSIHARCSHHKDSAFIAFQPDHCFDRHGISSKNPHRYKITESVRAMFEKGGSGYGIDLVSRSIKAVRYIKPQLIGQSPIRWWETDICCK